MFQRRGKHLDYSPQQTKYWLSFLAQQLVKYNQTEFSLGQHVQPAWLSDWHISLLYRVIVGLVTSLIYGLFCGLVGGLGGTLLVSLVGGLGSVQRGGLIGGLIGVLGGGLIGGLFSGLKRQITENIGLSWSWKQWVLDQGGILFDMLFMGLGSGVTWWLISLLITRLFFGQAVGQVVGLVCMLASGLEYADPEVIQRMVLGMTEI